MKKLISSLQLPLVMGGAVLLVTVTTSAIAQPVSGSSTAATTATNTCAQNQPVNLLVCVSGNLLRTLKRERATIKNNHSYIYTIVDRELLPYVDTMKMSQSVLGRRAWSQMTPQQRERFSKAFINLVVRTYAGALDAYSDEGVKFFPIRGGVGNRTTVTVSSQIVRSEGPPVSVTYSLSKKENKWQVYDMTVEGVSLLQSFHSQIQSMLSQGNSINQIITRLEQHPTSN